MCPHDRTVTGGDISTDEESIFDMTTIGERHYERSFFPEGMPLAQLIEKFLN